MAYEAVDEIVCSVMPGEVRLALLAEGRPVEFIVEREDYKKSVIALNHSLCVNSGTPVPVA